MLGMCVESDRALYNSFLQQAAASQISEAFQATKVSGRFEITNFRVSTASDLPATGPTSLALDFADGGPGPLTRPAGANLSYGACPAFAASSGCDGGCEPAASARCVHVQHGLLDGTSLSFDLPRGIDVTGRWSISII